MPSPPECLHTSLLSQESDIFLPLLLQALIDSPNHFVVEIQLMIGANHNLIFIVPLHVLTPVIAGIGQLPRPFVCRNSIQ